MAIINITFNGVSADYPLDTAVALSDADVRRIAVEVVRAGGVRGMAAANLAEGAFDGYVVDRLGDKIYLRPKVPFGSVGVGSA